MKNMITIQPNGTAQEGISLNIMSQAFIRMAEKNPDATLSAKENFLCVLPGYGPAWIYIEQQDPIRRSEHDPLDVFSIAPNSTVYFVHDTNMNASFSLHCAPSGQMTFKHGYEQGPQKPQQARSGAPIEVQQAFDWLFDGEVGSSSKYLINELIFRPNNVFFESIDYGCDTPWDAGDYRRCFLLMERIPFIKDNLEKIVDLNENWKDILDNSQGPSEWERQYNKHLVSSAPSFSEKPSYRFPR